jgi:anti-sigma28 factor (negative regulator of flagellin synthesis)
MDNTVYIQKSANQVEQKEDIQQEQSQSRRPRSMTVLKLQWLAERVRKCRKIQQDVEAGTYEVSSEKVAKALLCID